MATRMIGQAVGVVVIGVVLFTTATSTQGSIDLFNLPEGTNVVMPDEPLPPGVLRSHRLQARMDTVDRLREFLPDRDEGFRFRLALFPDVQRDGVVERVSSILDGGTLLSGVVADEPRSRWSLALVGDAIVGEASWPGRVFRWATVDAGDGVVAVDEMDLTYQWPEIEPDGFPLPDLNSLPESGPTQVPGPEIRNTTIDLLLFYTRDVLNALPGSQSLVFAELGVAVDFLNAAMDEAGSSYSFELVGANLLDTEAPSDDHVLLDDVSLPSGAFFEAVDAVRRAVGADLVHVYTSKRTGMARLVSRGLPHFPWPEQSQGFGVSGRDSLYRGYILAHEVGHNLGLWHDRRTLYIQLNNQDAYPQLRPWFAHPHGLGFARQLGQGRCVATIMAYYWLTCGPDEDSMITMFSDQAGIGSALECLVCSDDSAPGIPFSAPGDAVALLRSDWPARLAAYLDRPATGGRVNEE